MSRTVLQNIRYGQLVVGFGEESLFCLFLFSFLSLECVFPWSAAVVLGLSLGYDTGFVERGGRVRVASVVMWNKSHCLSGVAAAFGLLSKCILVSRS